MPGGKHQYEAVIAGIARRFKVEQEVETAFDSLRENWPRWPRSTAQLTTAFFNEIRQLRTRPVAVDPCGPAWARASRRHLSPLRDSSGHRARKVQAPRTFRSTAAAKHASMPPQQRHGRRTVASEFEAKIIQDFTRDIAGRLNEAALLARTADTYNGQGLEERAFSALLDIEPLLHEVTSLINATSVVHRRGQSIDPD